VSLAPEQTSRDPHGSHRPGHGHHDHHGHRGDPGGDDWYEFSLTFDEQLQLVLSATVLLVLGWLLEARWSAPLLAEMTFWAALGCALCSFAPEIMEHPVGVATLMAVASVGAAALPRGVHEGATLSVLFGISELLVHHTFATTENGLRGLLDLIPPKVTVRREGVERDIDPSGLVVGDEMIIRPGERLATDGQVLSGVSFVDLSAVTGESLPVEVHPGSVVFAAALNGSGALVVEVTAEVTESSLGQVVHILDQAAGNRGLAETFVDRLASWLVPLALVAGASLYLWGVIGGDTARWAYRALLVMVALSPCAFVIALPVTILASVGSASQAGVLIKGGRVIEALAGIRLAALDKTGTLTASQPRILRVVTGAGHRQADILAVAAALECRSEHPLARAILAAVDDVEPGEAVRAIPGRGLVGVVAGRPARLGHPGFVPPQALADEVTSLQHAGATVVVVEHDGETIGAVGVRDELRPEAAEAVTGMRAVGIARVVMLTGDNAATAEALGHDCGIDEVRAELLPGAKVQMIRDMAAAAPVLMVGDGINDAPALACASVGLAMGALGTDLAVEAADAALMGEDLRSVPALLAHARRTRRILRQNIVLSALTILALVPLAVTGVLTLAPMVLFHELTGVLIVLNGLRAGKTLPAPSRERAAVDKAESAGKQSIASLHRGKTPATRRIATSFAGLVIILGLGGSLLHLRVARPNRYLVWQRQATPILVRISHLDDNDVLARSCPSPESIDDLERQLPDGPGPIRGWINEMFDRMRKERMACNAGDRASMVQAGDAVMSTIGDIVTYVDEKANGHQH
jgi:cation-transporting P-type ATPase G